MSAVLTGGLDSSVAGAALPSCDRRQIAVWCLETEASGPSPSYFFFDQRAAAARLAWARGASADTPSQRALPPFGPPFLPPSRPTLAHDHAVCPPRTGASSHGGQPPRGARQLSARLSFSANLSAGACRDHGDVSEVVAVIGSPGWSRTSDFLINRRGPVMSRSSVFLHGSA